MTLPHDHYGPDGYPHLHSRGNSAITADPDWLANEHGDMLPLGSTVGKGPQGDGVIALVKESDDVKGTFILQFLNDKTMETFLESPNLHAGILSARTDDSNHTLYIDLMRKGFNKQIAEITIPQGEEGTRVFVNKNNQPVEIEAKSPEDLEYTFDVNDLRHQGQSEIEPRVYDIVLANICWKPIDNNAISPDVSYFAAGIIQGVTRKNGKVDNPVEKVNVVFRTLYAVTTQIQTDYKQLDPNAIDFIKNRQFIETVENKISDLLQEPTDPEQYPTAMAVYKELERMRDTRAIAAVCQSHAEMLEIPLAQIQENDIVLVLHDETLEPFQNVYPQAYWRFTGRKNKKNLKKIPESWFELIASIPPLATLEELQAEIDRAKAAEKQLQENLDAETKARSDADDALTKAIESEVKQRQDADKVLDEAKLNKIDPHLTTIVKDEESGIATITDEKGNQTTVGGGQGGGVTQEYVDKQDAKRLEKITTSEAYERAYIINPDGSQGTFQIARGAALGDSIARRTANGQLIVNEPTADNHTATKKYVDDSIAALPKNLNVITINETEMQSYQLEEETIQLINKNPYTALYLPGDQNCLFIRAGFNSDDSSTFIYSNFVRQNNRKNDANTELKTLVVNLSDGQFFISSTQMTTNSELDNALIPKLDKLPTGQNAQVYARNSSGSEVGIGYSANPGTGSTLALFDTSGNLRTGTPTSNTQATNKQYVDNAISPINDRLNGITAKEFIFTLEDGTTETYYLDTESAVLKSKKRKAK